MERNQTRINAKSRKRKRKKANRLKRANNIRRILTNPKKWNFKLIIIVIGVMYIASKFLGQQIAISDLRQEKAQRQENIKKLNNDIKDLTNKIENKTDIVYIERIARDDLKMLRPGEIMYEDKDGLLK